MKQVFEGEDFLVLMAANLLKQANIPYAIQTSGADALRLPQPRAIEVGEADYSAARKIIESNLFINNFSRKSNTPSFLLNKSQRTVFIIILIILSILAFYWAFFSK